MPTTIKLKNSVTTTNAPSSLAQGEVAINVTDKKVWVGNAATTPVQLLGTGADGTFTNLTVSGVASFADGTVSLPSITNIGDTNTGIFFPAADTIAFTEGGVESMRIDASGNLAIGNSSPAARLDIQQANPTRGIFQRVYNSTAGGSQTGAQIQFTQDSRADWVIGQPAATDAFAIWSGRNPSADGSERMRIDSFGRVGIGTSSPDADTLLTVAGAVTITGFNTGHRASCLKLGQDTSAISQIRFYGANNSTAGILQFTSSSADSSVGGERMRITAAGDVGIGTTAPTGKLGIGFDNATIRIGQVNSTDRNINIRANTGYNASMTFTEEAVSDRWTIGTVSGSNGFIFATGSTLASGTERMRIDSSGNLLIGTTSGSYRFMVSSSIADWSASIASTNASSPYGLRLFYSGVVPNNATNQFLYCADTGNTRAEFRSNGGLANYSGNNVNLSDVREKTNVELAGSYLDKICAIPVKTFNYIDQNRDEDDGLTLGVIAQDVQAVAPELVMESNWAAKDQPEKMRLSIYQTDLQYALMKCIQEQQALIENLTTRLTALEGN